MSKTRLEESEVSLWYAAARPAAVRIECCRPSGFLSEVVRTHNPIAP